MPDKLTSHERSRLATLEVTIERGLQTCYEVGAALTLIRDSTLYRQHYASFEDYCEKRWKLSRPRAYQLIANSQTVAEIKDVLSSQMSTVVDICGHGEEEMPLPDHERQTRPLEGLAPKQKYIAWEKSVESANGHQPTAKQV